ncbi:hypothetical protein AHF37_06175 [Paragonimus kellicotti]|nr:hypothetical protein AHF37_06175 [Paragonimus kellicotti]
MTGRVRKPAPPPPPFASYNDSHNTHHEPTTSANSRADNRSGPPSFAQRSYNKPSKWGNKRRRSEIQPLNKKPDTRTRSIMAGELMLKDIRRNEQFEVD